MPPIVHLVRHAEGYHQVPHDNPNVHIRDPDLTPHGVQQCKDFCATFPRHDRIELLCASPLRRTIKTAMLCFEPEIKRGLKIIPLPDAQETTALESDTGSSPAKIKEEFGDVVDCSDLKEDWYVKTGRNATDSLSLRARAKAVRLWLRERQEKEVVLVAHGVIAHHITGNIDSHGQQTGEYWLNVRERSFQFLEENDEDAAFVETEASKQRVLAREHTEKP